ncbi:MAG: alkyl sulfatase dimerization domain-containing protein [Alphaproteobacteria bacterium]|nr:alkyl sulfatase dimerization domain-containing protein [Alphaproteobacteria bacterium]
MTKPKPASPTTQAAQKAVLDGLPFEDQFDFEQAQRGFIAAVPDGVILNERGRALWDLNEYDFLAEEEAPDSVNPSLWRLSRLNMFNGLFKVCERVYQLRAFDVAVMTVIEGDSGLILIDPMTTAEAARAGLDLYYAHRPHKPVLCVIYSHSHIDHYGGVMGVTSADDVAAGKVQIIAPDRFMEELSGESVLAGNAMLRRAQFQIGGLLEKSARGQIDTGLGKGAAKGRITLIAPTQVIREATETHNIDGIEMVFQLAPDSEAPAEMHMFMPQFAILNMAENTTRHLHNFIPLRGAVARDPRIWSRHISEAMVLFGERTDILIGQHHWPTWGRDEVRAFLEKQRDLYKYIHDQTVRLMNHGLNREEIAEQLDLPTGLDQEWSVRGYYGTVSHNSKAVYQRYLSWYDGNPANLNPLPRREAGTKMVDYMGGAEALLIRAQADFEAGEYRWVAQVLSHLVFAEPENPEGRELLADTFEQLGYQAESATWRNAYLYGAQELRQGLFKLSPRPPVSPETLTALTASALFDFMAIRLNADKAAGLHWRINWHLGNSDERLVMNLQNCTMTHVLDQVADDAVVSVRLSQEVLVAINVRQTDVAEALAAGDMEVDGDVAIVEQLFAMLDDFSLMFDVVAPSLKEE